MKKLTKKKTYKKIILSFLNTKSLIPNETKTQKKDKEAFKPVLK